MNEQEKIVRTTSAQTVQMNPLVVPAGIAAGAVAGALLGAFKARNQEVRPGLYSGWSGYLTVVGAALGWAMCAPLVSRPRKRRR